MFWNWFRPAKTEVHENTLYSKLVPLVDINIDKQSLFKMSCLAGLLAKVAFVDLVLDPREKSAFLRAIQTFNLVSSAWIEQHIDLIFETLREISGREDHLYLKEVKENFSQSERVLLVEALFMLAGSDENVSVEETDEVRKISQMLGLGHQEYMMAKLKVADKIGALR